MAIRSVGFEPSLCLPHLRSKSNGKCKVPDAFGRCYNRSLISEASKSSEHDTNDGIFRNLYIASDFIAFRNGFRHTTEKEEPPAVDLCPHGNERARCLEIDCIEIVDAQISQSENHIIDGESVVEYCIQVDYHNSNVCNIWCRFSTFRQLYRVLVSRFGKEIVPEVPSKTFQTMSNKVVAKRMKALNDFLSKIIDIDSLRRSREIKLFLSPDESIRLTFSENSNNDNEAN